MRDDDKKKGKNMREKYSSLFRPTTLPRSSSCSTSRSAFRLFFCLLFSISPLITVERSNDNGVISRYSMGYLHESTLSCRGCKRRPGMNWVSRMGSTGCQ